MIQMEDARVSNITEEMRIVANDERIEEQVLQERIACGRVVIPHNINHRLGKVSGIGEGLRTKVNANVGTTVGVVDLYIELEKVKVAIASGADTIMDLSIGGDLDAIRREILSICPIPFGTVPIYQAICEAIKRDNSIMGMNKEGILEVIERQAKDGVDFMTIHAGVTLECVERLKREGRILDVVSRGGAFLVEWMVKHHKENPLYEGFDQILEIAQRYDVTLSLGDGFRPGTIVDATDRSQIQELIILGELTKRAWKNGVGVIIEGPGHVPINQIKMNVQLQKELCYNAPFYVLGPLVTDVASGYDHISAAIGGAIAASYGADFLCYVTPGEHLRLPTIEDVKEGVIAARIAAHGADIAKGVKGSIEWDKSLSEARKKRDWTAQIKLAIDPQKAQAYHSPSVERTCTMCGDFCAIKIVTDSLLGTNSEFIPK